MPGAPEGPDLSLVLRLRMRNVSRNTVFSPADPFFDRRWRRLADGKKPYTYLQMGNQYFYGGPLSWNALPAAEDEKRELIRGQVYQHLLPGAETSTFVCTSPEDHLADFLRKYHGECEWRVQVRRGLVKVGEREVSATAVVGVYFRESEILKPET
jgi:hypothetical protein